MLNDLILSNYSIILDAPAPPITVVQYERVTGDVMTDYFLSVGQMCRKKQEIELSRFKPFTSVMLITAAVPSAEQVADVNYNQLFCSNLHVSDNTLTCFTSYYVHPIAMVGTSETISQLGMFGTLRLDGAFADNLLIPTLSKLCFLSNLTLDIVSL